MSNNYSAYLPTALQNDPIIKGFLQAFGAVLSGVEGEGNPPITPTIVQNKQLSPPGLEAIVHIIDQYFDPDRTPKDFLPWLASWVGLSLWEEWDEPTKRNFIRQIVPLYQRRGTKAGLITMLKLYLKSDKETVNIYEFDQPAHYFQVELSLGSQNLKEYRRKERIARAIIDQEKPAHTFYTLRVMMPTMQIFESAEQAATKQGVMLKLGGESTYRNRTILGSRSARDINQERTST